MGILTRMVTYVLSGWIGLIPPIALDWIVFGHSQGWVNISIHIENAVGLGLSMAITAIGIPWAVLRKWGKF